MPFHDRIYSVYAILGAVDAPPWSTSIWARIREALIPLVEHARGRTAMRSGQYTGTAPSMTRMSFGRLGLDEKSSLKWTHSRRDELASGVRATFLNAELWAPSWTICERESMAPDVFFGLAREGAIGQDAAKRCFGSTLILAIANDIDAGSDGDLAAQKIGDAVVTVFVGKQVRPWGAPVGDIGFTNAINDLPIAGLFVPGPRHEVPPSLSLLQGDWEALHAKALG
jgi:hypothetical protein